MFSTSVENRNSTFPHLPNSSEKAVKSGLTASLEISAVIDRLKIYPHAGGTEPSQEKNNLVVRLFGQAPVARLSNLRNILRNQEIPDLRATFSGAFDPDTRRFLVGPLRVPTSQHSGRSCTDARLRLWLRGREVDASSLENTKSDWKRLTSHRYLVLVGERDR